MKAKVYFYSKLDEYSQYGDEHKWADRNEQTGCDQFVVENVVDTGILQIAVNWKDLNSVHPNASQEYARSVFVVCSRARAYL
jgi:hypothetical protein